VAKGRSAVLTAISVIVIRELILFLDEEIALLLQKRPLFISYKTTDKIIFSHILIFTFLNSRHKDKQFATATDKSVMTLGMA
jgi:hypothetical protein